MERLKRLPLGEKLVEQFLKAHGDFPYNFRFVEPSIPYFPAKEQADIAQKAGYHRYGDTLPLFVLFYSDEGRWGDAPAVEPKIFSQDAETLRERIVPCPQIFNS